MALDTKKFLSRLIELNYTHICVVPCSFAKYLINESINNPKIEYIASANEAVAISIAAGLKLVGKKPIVIAQSSGLTNMGSAITSLLKPYNITLAILISWRSYKYGDSEIQHQHLATNLPNLIESYGYTHTILDSNNLEKAISQIENSNKMPNICIIKKDSFLEAILENRHKVDLSNYAPRGDFLKLLSKEYKKENIIFIGTTGNTSREMYAFMSNRKNFYMAGNMGGALSIALGVAKGGREVIVCGGDAEFSMQLGGLVTAGRYSNELDLTYILFDNETNKSTGGQNSYQQHINYINIAKGCNFEIYSKIITTLEEFSFALRGFENIKKIKFLHVKCGYDKEVVRPPLETVRTNTLC